MLRILNCLYVFTKTFEEDIPPKFELGNLWASDLQYITTVA